MSQSAGYVMIKGPTGRIYRVPTDRRDAVLAAVPGSMEYTPPKPTLGGFISGLSDKNTYTSPERSRELLGQALRGEWDLIAQNAPIIGSVAATLPLGGIGGVAGLGARTAAMGVGAYGGSLAGDAMQGKPPDLNAAARQVGPNMAWGLGGEAVAAGAEAGARSLTRKWARPTPTMMEESPQLLQDMLDSRATYRRGGKPAKEPLAAKQQSMNNTNQMLAAHRTSGITVDDALAQVNAMRSKIASYAPTDARLADIDAFTQAFRQKWEPVAQANGGVIPVEDAYQIKLQAQDEAKFTGNSNEPATNKLMHKMVAQDVRVAVGKQVPPSRGSLGYNKQDEMTHRYHEAAAATERAASLPPPASPMPAHVIGAALGGSAGAALHGPLGATGGIASSEILLRLLENPYFANRLAMFLHSPSGQSAARIAPRVVQSTLPRAQKAE